MVDKIVYRKILSLRKLRCLFLINFQLVPAEAQVSAPSCDFPFLNEYQC
jgi:hypothetical protein